MMSRQHSDDPVAHGDTGAKGSGCECVMQGWWGDPGYRVPTGQRRRNEEEQLTFTDGYNIQTCISYNTCIRSRAVVSAVIPFGACIIGTNQV